MSISSTSLYTCPKCGAYKVLCPDREGCDQGCREFAPNKPCPLCVPDGYERAAAALAGLIPGKPQQLRRLWQQDDAITAVR